VDLCDGPLRVDWASNKRTTRAESWRRRRSPRMPLAPYVVAAPSNLGDVAVGRTVTPEVLCLNTGAKVVSLDFEIKPDLSIGQQQVSYLNNHNKTSMNMFYCACLCVCLCGVCVCVRRNPSSALSPLGLVHRLLEDMDNHRQSLLLSHQHVHQP
jgi:hypothetical protein